MRVLAEHLKDKQWFAGVRYAVSPAGYRMLLVMRADDDFRRGIMQDGDVPRELFDIPVSFYADDQDTVTCAKHATT